MSHPWIKKKENTWLRGGVILGTAGIDLRFLFNMLKEDEVNQLKDKKSSTSGRKPKSASKMQREKKQKKKKRKEAEQREAFR